MNDVSPIKRKLGVPSSLESCHTAVVGGYTVEGHVPADVVRQVLKQRPQSPDSPSPGMPLGSPGMERSSQRSVQRHGVRAKRTHERVRETLADRGARRVRWISSRSAARSGFAFAAGVNLYATVAILGLAARYGWVELPAQYDVFNNDVVIGVAIALYLIEFFADKIPYVDTLWDMIHTVIRPVGGALIAVATLGDASPTVEGLVALRAASSPPAVT